MEPLIALGSHKGGEGGAVLIFLCQQYPAVSGEEEGEESGCHYKCCGINGLIFLLAHHLPLRQAELSLVAR